MLTEKHIAKMQPKISKITSTKVIGGIRYCLVSWEGWPDSFNIWLSEDTIDQKILDKQKKCLSPSVSFGKKNSSKIIKVPKNSPKSSKKKNSRRKRAPFADLSNVKHFYSQFSVYYNVYSL